MWKRITGFVIAFSMIAMPVSKGVSSSSYFNNNNNSVSGIGLLDADETTQTITIYNEQDLITYLGSGASSPDSENVIYILNDNLDMSSYSSFLPVTEFKGKFNGNNKTISNLKINTTQGSTVAAFVNKLADGAIIEKVNFNRLEIIGSAKTAAVAVECRGSISNVHINNSKITTTAERATSGGIVAEFYYDTATMSNCSVKAEFSITNGTNVGGAIGKLDKTVDPSSKISNVYWDMRECSATSTGFGGKTDYNCVLGVKMPESIDVIVGSNNSYSNIVTYQPITVIPNATFSVDNINNIIVQNSSSDGFVANNIGKSSITHSINVGGHDFSISITINVVANKTALKALYDEAKEMYPSQDHYGNTYDDFQTVMNSALLVYNNSLSTTAQVDEAISNLQNIISALIAKDKERLNELLEQYKDVKSLGHYYDSQSHGAFSSAYDNAQTHYNDANVKSNVLRNAYTSLNNTYNDLKLLLGDVTVERRVETIGETKYEEIIIMIDGFKDKSKQFGSVSTSVTSSGDIIHQTDPPIDNKIKIVISRNNIPDKLFNLGGNITVQVTNDGKLTAPETKPLEARENYILENIDLGSIAIISKGENLEKVSKNLSNIKILFDTKTGEEKPTTISGTVESWDFDNSDPSDEQNSFTTGTKRIIGKIASTSQYKNLNENYAIATIEVIDKTELDTLIAEANTYKQADYTQDSWLPFNTAFSNAKLVKANASATQEEIIKAINDLKQTMAEIKKQPKITLKKTSATILKGDVFEPLLQVQSVTQVGDDGTLIDDLKITVDGEDATSFDTNKVGKFEILYSITNEDEITATAVFNLTITEKSGTDSTNTTTTTKPGDGDSDIEEILKEGVIIEVDKSDILTKDEIANGATIDVEVTKITDTEIIQAILDGPLSSLLKGNVTIDGIYDIKLYKVIDGEKVKVQNSSITQNIKIYLPISQEAIDSNDYASIHALDNSGYELLKITVTTKNGEKYALTQTKQFSQFAVAYGAGIASVADALNTDETTTTTTTTTTSNTTTQTTANTANTTTNTSSTDTISSTNDTNNESTDNGKGGSVNTGDNFPIIIIIGTVILSLIGIVVIVIVNKKKKKE